MARLSAGGGGGGGGDWGVCAAEAMRLRGGELGVCRAYLYGGTGSPGVMVIVCVVVGPVWRILCCSTVGLPHAHDSSCQVQVLLLLQIDPRELGDYLKLY